MLTIFGKKKITAERTAHIFSHNIVETVEKGFKELAGFINDSPEFVKSPNVRDEDYGKFLMIVIAGNFNYIPQHFKDGQDEEIIHYCIEKLAPVFDMSIAEFGLKIKEYKDFMSRVNSPSKNTLYAMSRAIFFKYDLCTCQDEYFSQMNTANPIFLKNLDEFMKNFIWDWEVFNEKYKVIATTAA